MKNKDIAAILNVTPAAVSMAINGKGGVSEDKRKKILELKYNTPDSVKKQGPSKGRIQFYIHRKNGNVIADTHFFLSIMTAIQTRAEEHGYGTDIIHYDPGEDFMSFASRSLDENVKGIIVLATEIDSEDMGQYRKLDLPLVAIDNWFEEEDYDCILMDNIEGIKRAVRYGYNMGHRKIGFIKSTTEIYNFKERYTGFLQGMRRVKVPVEKKYIFRTRCTTDGAYEDMCRIIKTGCELPSLLIVPNDVMAIGIMNALKYSGYRIPRDVSIISFDNMPLSKYFSPAFTSVDIEDKRIAQIAVERLVDKIENGQPDYFIHELVGVKLVIRDSVADLRVK